MSHRPPPSRLSALLIGLIAIACTVPAAAQSAGGEAEESSKPAPRPDLDVRALLDAFDDEPSVRRVQQRALDRAGLDRKSVKRWPGRARLSNLLPEVSGELGWLDQRDAELQYSEDIVTDESGEMYRDEAQNDFSDDKRLRRLYSVEAEVDLGGLIFDRDEIAAARELRRRESLRQKLLARVTDLYFDRRKKQILRRATPPGNWRKRLQLELEIRRMTARIDGLTGGWFSRALHGEAGRGGNDE